MRSSVWRLLRYLLAYGVGLPTVADTLELLKGSTGSSADMVTSATASSVPELLQSVGLDPKLDETATMDLLQALEQMIPVLAQALAKLMDGSHQPGVVHKPVTFDVGGIRFHESVLQRLSQHVFGIAAGLCQWMSTQLEVHQSLDSITLQTALNLVATVHCSTCAAVDTTSSGSFLRIATMYADRFLQDGEMSSSIQDFMNAWNGVIPLLAPCLCHHIQSLKLRDASISSLSVDLLVARLCPIVWYVADHSSDSDTAGQAVTNTQLFTHLTEYCAHDPTVLTHISEGIGFMIRVRQLVWITHTL